MKFRAATLILAGVWGVGLLHATTAAQAPAAAAKSVWDGVYTEEQAKRGQEAYKENCAECHSPELSGDGFAPALAAADFLNNWNGLTVGDLFERIRISMPPGKENSVPPQGKADIVAYILQVNKFPVGKEELPPAADKLKGIKFEATKPGN